MILSNAIRYEDLADNVGTPLYVYDLRLMQARLLDMRDHFPSFEISYAVKTNPNPSVCRMFANVGATAGVSSLREIDLAIAAGFRPESLDFVSPGKDSIAISSALKRDVGLISVESEAELRRVSAAALALGIRGSILLRVNTKHRASDAGELMAGGSSAFGIDQEQITKLLANMPDGVDCQGFHTFPASQILNERFIIVHFQRVAEMSVAFSRQASFDLHTVNYGGGFGVPYREFERPLDMIQLGQSVEQGPAGKLARDGVRSIIDVGRYLTAEAGVFLTRIVDIKRSRGANYIVVESGIGGFSRPAMHWGQPHPAGILGRKANGGSENFKIVGPSCMPSDVLAESVELESPEVGEIVAIYDAGAYGLSMSLIAWGGSVIPKEACILPTGECVIREIALDSHERWYE